MLLKLLTKLLSQLQTNFKEIIKLTHFYYKNYKELTHKQYQQIVMIQ